MFGGNPVMDWHPNQRGWWGESRNTPSHFLPQKLEWVLAWWTTWDIMQTWLPPSELPFAEQVLVQNVSHEKHLIFMRMTVQVTYIFIPIVRTNTRFATEAKVNLGLGYSSMSCSGSLWFSFVLNWVVNFSMINKYGPILSVEKKSNRRKREFYKQWWRYYKDLYGINKWCYSYTNMGTTRFYFQIYVPTI